MFPVISGIIAIAIFATLMAYNAGHLTPDSLIRRETHHLVQGAVGGISTAFQAYRVANNGARPTSANWKSELSDYAPGRSIDVAVKAPKGMSWSYAVAPAKSWVCLSGASVSKAVLEGIVTSLPSLSGGSAWIAESCPADGASRAEGESKCEASDAVCATTSPAQRAVVIYLQG